MLAGFGTAAPGEMTPRSISGTRSTALNIPSCDAGAAAGGVCEGVAIRAASEEWERAPDYPLAERR